MYVKSPSGFGFLKVDAWHTRVCLFHKAIGHACTQVVGGVAIGMNRYLAQSAERAQVVESAYVVVMLVGDENSVYPFKSRSSKHLLAKVGAAIYQDDGIISVDKCRGAQAVVARVGGRTYGACASYFGYSRRCAAA